MSPDRDPRMSPVDEPEEDFEEEEEAPRSIFSATWFRVVLVLLGIGVVGAVAVPHVLDVVNTPETPAPRTAAAPTPAPPAPPSSGASAPNPAPPAPSATSGMSTPESAKPAPSSATTVPSTAAPSTAAPVAKPEPKSEPRAAEPKAPASAKAPAAVAEAPKSDAKPADRTAAAKTAPDKAPVKKAPAEKPAGARASAAAKSSGGDYFVQVGAFRDQATAQRVASRLREQSYPVDESLKRTGDAPSASPRPAPAPRATASGGSGSDRYDVIVSGGSSAEINTRLAAKGLASEPAGDSVRIRPSLSLRDAVALSKDLGSEGFKVQVRRGGGGGAVSAEPAPSAAPAMDSGTGGQTLYRVRVGGYPDRATAQAVLKELQDKGYQPFIAKGRE